MKKVIFLLTAVLLAAAMFAGCANQETQQSQPQVSETLSQAVTSSAAVESGSAAPAQSNGKKLLIGISIQGLDNPYYQQIKEGAEIFQEQIKKEGVDSEIAFLECRESEEKQVNDIKSLIARGGKDTIIYIDAISAPIIAEVADICEEAQVYWSACWSTADDCYPTDYKYYVLYQTPDDTNAGYEIAKYMFSKFKTPNQGSVAAIHGVLGNSSTNRRKKGLEKALAEFPNVKLLDQQAGDFMASKALTITQTWLAKYNETTLNGIWTCNDDMTMGTIEALKGKSLNGKILSCGVDGIPDAITSIKNGDMICSYASNGWLQAFYGLAYPYAAYKGEIDTTKLDAGQRMIFTPGVLITKENLWF